MRHRVTAKQQNSQMCLVCGTENQFGLHTSFYELENGELVGLFTPGQQHQGYPERLHGGIATAILDETIGRAMMIKEPDFWFVTIEITVRFRKPIPLEEELRVVGRISSVSSRSIEGTGEILLKDGRVAAEARGKYLKVPLDKITGAEFGDADWRVIRSDGDPEVIEI